MLQEHFFNFFRLLSISPLEFVLLLLSFHRLYYGSVDFLQTLLLPSFDDLHVFLIQYVGLVCEESLSFFFNAFELIEHFRFHIRGES